MNFLEHIWWQSHHYLYYLLQRKALVQLEKIYISIYIVDALSPEFKTRLDETLASLPMGGGVELDGL